MYIGKRKSIQYLYCVFSSIFNYDNDLSILKLDRLEVSSTRPTFNEQ